MGSFVCQSDCYDIVPDHCPRWAGNGECGANPDYMHLNCRQSCGMCGEYKRRELVLLLRNILESRKMKGGPKGSSKGGPKPTGDIGPLPTGFDDLGPMPTGFDDLGPLPTGFDDLVPCQPDSMILAQSQPDSMILAQCQPDSMILAQCQPETTLVHCLTHWAHLLTHSLTHRMTHLLIQSQRPTRHML